ncbi:MAG TPA: endolytic transglycosylase MltG [Candidatus Paceibacterota bacterium]
MKILFFSLIVISVLYFSSAPGGFPINKKAEIIAGASVADSLREQDIIRSASLFKVLSLVMGASDELKAGRYVFDERLSVWSVLSRVRDGEYGLSVRKVTIPEGSSNKQIGEILGMKITTEDQGYLFPDTYFFDQFVTSQEVRESMKANFIYKVGQISHDDLVLASLVEEEASSTSDRRLVAGILEKRLSLDMPLQVDVAPETYNHNNLPSEPIVNPGLDAIEAVGNPAPSKYLYYLSDKLGVIHYAVTFEEHKRNREKYGI